MWKSAVQVRMKECFSEPLSFFLLSGIALDERIAMKRVVAENERRCLWRNAPLKFEGAQDEA
jgi:hypothetical protein